MKPSRTIVHESQKKKMGRPRSVSEDDLAPAISVRLPPVVLSQVDRWTAEKEMTRSETVRWLVELGLDAASKRAVAPKRGKGK